MPYRDFALRSEQVSCQASREQKRIVDRLARFYRRVHQELNAFDAGISGAIGTVGRIKVALDELVKEE